MTYSHQPGEKRASRFFIPANGFPRLYKYLLCQVLGVGDVSHPVANMPVYPVNVHIVEPPKGIGVAPDSLIYQPIDIGCGVGIFVPLQLVFHFV